MTRKKCVQSALFLIVVNALVGQFLGCPLEAELAMMLNTISQVQIDEILIRNPSLFGHRLEVANNVGSHSDGNLLLQA